MELGIVGTMSNLIASEAAAFFHVLLPLIEGKVDGSDRDAAGWTVFPPSLTLASNGLRGLPLLIESGCSFVPFLEICRHRPRAVDLVVYGWVYAVFEQHYDGGFLFDSGASDQLLELGNMIIHWSASLFEMGKRGLVRSLLVCGSEVRYDRFLEIVPGSIASARILIEEG